MSLQKAKSYLKNKSLEDRIILLEESSATVDLAAKALGVTPGEIAKSLSFLVSGKPILILTKGDAKIDNAKYKQQFHKKAEMIKREEVNDYIGHEPGGVCPFGINENVKVFLDVSLKQYDIVYPACGTSNSAVKLKVEELESILSVEEWIDVTKDV